MACRTLNFRPDVWRVIKADVGFISPTVDALPWNFLATHFVRGHFLDFRLVRRNRLVTDHAVLDARNARNRAFRNSNVTEIALQLGYFNVRLVLICNRLNRFGADTEEMTNRLAERFVSGGKYLI